MPVMGHVESLAVRSLLRRPNLTAERERQLLRTRHASGDDAARQQALSELWESHAKLVLAVARQYHRPDLSMSELVGAGHLGMRAAIDGFDRVLETAPTSVAMRTPLIFGSKEKVERIARYFSEGGVLADNSPLFATRGLLRR